MKAGLIGTTLLHLDSATSTNIHLLELASKSRPADGTVVVAWEQTHGRGMDTNTWESEPGKNLTFSIILYPSFLSPDKQFLITQAISLGVADHVQKMTAPNKVTIKWPNDIYHTDNKICGILIQNSIIGSTFDYVVAGIGLNVNQEVFRSDAPNPVSLRMITGKNYLLPALLEDLLQSLDLRYLQLREGKTAMIRQEYLKRLYRFEEWQYYSIKGETHQARILGTTSYGQLVLEGRNATRWECHSKEVVYLTSEPSR